MSTSFLIICLLFLSLNTAAILIYPDYIGVTRRKGIQVWLCTLLLALGASCLLRLHYARASQAICTFLFAYAAVPFAVKLYLKLVAGQLTAQEKAPGMEGVRAWLGGGNLVFALLITLLGWQAFDFSIIGTLAATVALLILYPLLNLSQEAPKSADTTDLAADRERILQMLADGKITANDSADLLNALGSTARRPSSSPPTPGRKLVVTGAALVLLGFFLPWFSGNVQPAYSPFLSGNIPAASQQLPMQPSFNINIAGGDIIHGLGWLVLALALGVAALPYIAPHIDTQTQRMFTLLALGVGAMIIAYLISQSIRLASIGIVFAALGYGCAILGEWKETPRSS